MNFKYFIFIKLETPFDRFLEICYLQSENDINV